jgi:hypothetical protein
MENQNGKESKAFQMVNYNLTIFTAMIDDLTHLKHIAIAKDPLQTVYDGRIENLSLHIQDFTC